MENFIADHCFFAIARVRFALAIHSASSRRNGSTSVTRRLIAKAGVRPPAPLRRIDIEQNCLHSGRQHAGDGERMLERGEKQHMGYIGEFLSHHFLSFERVCGYTGNRSLVADRASQHDIERVWADAGVHGPWLRPSFVRLRRCRRPRGSY